MAWGDPVTWLGVYVSIGFAYSPLLCFLLCVLKVHGWRTATEKNQWFTGTVVGPHRIDTTVHAIWLATACTLSGVAQLFAWNTVNTPWYYGVAMVLFPIYVLSQCGWALAYFSVHGEFRTGAYIAIVTLVIGLIIAVFYMLLSVLAGVFMTLRVVFHDLPIVYINMMAARREREYGTEEHTVSLSSFPETPDDLPDIVVSPLSTVSDYQTDGNTSDDDYTYNTRRAAPTDPVLSKLYNTLIK